MTHNKLGQLCLSHHDLPNAWKSFEDAKTHLDGLVENYPKEINYRSTLGGTLNNLGMNLRKVGAARRSLAGIPGSNQAAAGRHGDRSERCSVSRVSRRAVRQLRTSSPGGRPLRGGPSGGPARKRLWPKDPYRLFEVAADAAAAVQRIDAAGAAIPPDKAKAKEAFSDLAVAALREAVQTGMDRTQVLRNAADFRPSAGIRGTAR